MVRVQVGCTFVLYRRHGQTSENKIAVPFFGLTFLLNVVENSNAIGWNAPSSQNAQADLNGTWTLADRLLVYLESLVFVH